MGFDAAKLVKPIDFDLTKFGGKKGEIPEPSEAKMAAFYKAVDDLNRKVIEDYGLEVPADTDAMGLIALLSRVPFSTAWKPVLDGTTLIFADLCSGSPTLDELKALPPRVRTLFFQYVSRELRPELEAADSQNLRPTLRVAQGG